MISGLHAYYPQAKKISWPPYGKSLSEELHRPTGIVDRQFELTA
jgi:hypothetical protein